MSHANEHFKAAGNSWRGYSRSEQITWSTFSFMQISCDNARLKTIKSNKVFSATLKYV